MISARIIRRLEYAVPIERCPGDMLRIVPRGLNDGVEESTSRIFGIVDSFLYKKVIT